MRKINGVAATGGNGPSHPFNQRIPLISKQKWVNLERLFDGITVAAKEKQITALRAAAKVKNEKPAIVVAPQHGIAIEVMRDKGNNFIQESDIPLVQFYLAIQTGDHKSVEKALETLKNEIRSDEETWQIVTLLQYVILKDYYETMPAKNHQPILHDFFNKLFNGKESEFEETFEETADIASIQRYCSARKSSIIFFRPDVEYTIIGKSHLQHAVDVQPR